MILKLALVPKIDAPYSPSFLVDVEAKRQATVNFLAVLDHTLDVQERSSGFIHVIDDACNVERE